VTEEKIVERNFIISDSLTFVQKSRVDKSRTQQIHSHIIGGKLQSQTLRNAFYGIFGSSVNSISIQPAL